MLYVNKTFSISMNAFITWSKISFSNKILPVDCTRVFFTKLTSHFTPLPLTMVFQAYLNGIDSS